MMSDVSAGSKDLVSFITDKGRGMTSKSLDSIQHNVSQVKDNIQHQHDQQEPFTRKNQPVAHAILNKIEDTPVSSDDENKPLSPPRNNNAPTVSSSSSPRPVKLPNNLARDIINKAAKMSAQRLNVVPSDKEIQQSKKETVPVSPKVQNQSDSDSAKKSSHNGN